MDTTATPSSSTADLRRVVVDLGDRSYDVVVGHGAIAELPSVVPSTARRALVITQPNIPVEGVLAQLRMIDSRRDTSEGLQVEVVEIGTGEQFKTLDTVGELCRRAAQAGLTRQDLFVGVGGGMVTDVAGFAAASYHRGTPVIHVSTTLLGMIDAAIGGKTGVNLPEGKNLVGAFWQPSGVICDLDLLASLPEREVRCGYGEMAKYHFLSGDDLLSLNLTDRVARCVEIKAEVVASDERESGRRALLNYGHTLAHALEIATEHQMAHGEAVAIGLIFAAQLANVMGRVPAERIAQHIAVVGDEYGLDITLPAGHDPQALLELMRRDKKALTGLTFILDGPHGIEIITDVNDAPVIEALARMAS